MDEFKEMVVNSVNDYFDDTVYQKEIEAHEEEHSEEAITKLVKEKVHNLADEFRVTNT